jgi:GT2 family glycosyltransferase
MLLSVIIPTMWKCESFLEMLEMIVDDSHVNEVIIIDNDKESTPNHRILSHNKVRIYQSETNLFVCPSWNLGAKLAKNELLCFCQDDIFFDIKVFQKTLLLFETTSNVGVVGSLVSYTAEPSYEDKYYKFYTDGFINFVNSKEPNPEQRPPATGCGNLFFIEKNNWIEIPDEIKIFHGELLIWNHYDEIKDNYIITNFDIKTNWHTTWSYLANSQSRIFSEIQIKDQIECERNNFRI